MSVGVFVSNEEGGMFLPEQSAGVPEVGWFSANENYAKWKMIQR